MESAAPEAWAGKRKAEDGEEASEAAPAPVAPPLPADIDTDADAPPAAPAAVAAAAEQPEENKPWRGVTPRLVARLPSGALLCASQGSVVDFRGDALVNAANRGCLGGGGVDGAVNDAGGWELEKARRALPIVSPPYIRCPTGSAKLTVGGALRVRFVIHAVGPDYRACEDDEEGDALLASAYASAMQIAQERGFETLAFSLLSASIFRGDRSLRGLLEVSVRAVLAHSYPALREVHLVAYTGEEMRALVAAASAATSAGAQPDSQPVATAACAPTLRKVEEAPPPEAPAAEAALELPPADASADAVDEELQAASAE